MTRGSLIGSAAPFKGGGALRVKRHGLSRDHLRQIWANFVQIDGDGFLFACVADLGFFDVEECLAFYNGIAFAGQDVADITVCCGGYDMLHFHGFEDNHRLAFVYCIAFTDGDADDGPQHGRGDAGGSIGNFGLWGCSRSVTVEFTMIKNRKRVGRIQPFCG